MGIPENIDALLVKYDISQDRLAAIAEVTPGAVTGWRNGSQPRKDALRNMCEYFNLSEDDILSTAYGLAAKEHGMVPPIPGARRAVGVSTVKVPVIGRVHAGPAGDPEVFDEGYGEAEIPSYYFDIDPECYVLDFEGDCMSKDFGSATSLVVSPNSSFGNDSIVVAVVDGADYVVRRLAQSARELRLRPNSWNPEYEDIVIPRDSDKQVEFKGKVLGCFKRFE